MLLSTIGSCLLVLIVIFILGNLWFHVVESLLERVRHLLWGQRETKPWHPLPPDWEKSDAGEDMGQQQ